MTSTTRRRFALGFSAVAVASVTTASALLVTGRSVEQGRRDLLRQETATAAAILRFVPHAGALDSTFARRWTLTDELDPSLDQALVFESTSGLTGKAAVYDADSWFQIGVLYLAEPPDRSGSIPRTITITTLIVLVLMSGIIALWITRTGDPPLLRATSLAAAVALPTTPLVLAHVWAVAELGQATEQRLHMAVQALESLPDLDSFARRPGAITQLTGLAFLQRDALGETSLSSLPSAATEELAAIPAPFRGLIVADRVDYAVADVGSIRLAGLLYEDTHQATTTVILIALLGLAVAALPMSLARLVERPRLFHRNVVAWTFLAPSLVHITIFTVGPLVFAAWLSLHRWSLLDAVRPMVGLVNYVNVLTDGAFWNSIKNTVVFTLHVPFAMMIALAIALVVHRRVRGIVVLRATLFLPTITSLVAIAMVWQWMLHDEYGLINWLLSVAGLGPVRWLTSPATALISIMVMSVWMIVGYQMVLFQAGLSTIPQELYDAARIDGAGSWNRFIHVTLPGLRHTLFFVLVTSVIGSFQVFGAVYVMTEGGPLHSTDVAVYHIYREAWEFLRFGDAAAMSWVLFAIIFTVTLLQFRILEERLGEA